MPKHELYKCPKCGGEIEQKDTRLNLYLQVVSYSIEWVCTECNLEGQAGFNVAFDRHFAIREKDDVYFE